ncbi:MAG: ExeA family protein, partial [Burkholderiales bacterium]
TLEQVRLLSNLETSRHKLLQIVLFGQPELDGVLATTSMRQLKDRITHSFRMRPLAPQEVTPYLTFRMRAAGYRGPDVFGADAVARIARASSGLTRRINILADKALLSAFSEGVHGVTAKQANAAVADSEFADRPRATRPLAAIGAAALIGAAVAGAVAYWAMKPAQTPAPASPPTVSPTPIPAAPTSKAPQATASASAPAPASLLTRDQVQRLEGYQSSGHPLLEARLAASRDKLQSAPDTNYALELYVTDNSDAARLERFLARARDLVPLESVYLVPLPAGGHYRVWAVYGDFPSRDAAAQAARRLPPKYQKAFPLEPRSFAELRHGF